MTWVFSYHMKMASARLKIVILTVICDGYGVDVADETWVHGDWFYTTGYGIFGHEVKAKKKAPIRQYYVMDHHTV